VIKNKPAYYNQALMEIQLLRAINEKYDPNNEHHLLRMVESFNCKGHLCLVFELVTHTRSDTERRKEERKAGDEQCREHCGKGEERRLMMLVRMIDCGRVCVLVCLCPPAVICQSV